MTGENKLGCIHYRDEENDEVAGIKRNTVSVNKTFRYIRKNPLWRIAEFVVYRLIMMPFAYLYCKIKFHHKVIGREKLKVCKNKGYFMYGNHTLYGGDAFIPNLINRPRKTYVIVHADNISLPLTKNFLLMNGAIPIPTDFHAKKNFLGAIEKRIVEHNCVTIYPEAHVWPYCTFIRPLHTSAFAYPVKFRDPVYCFTNTFSHKKHGKTPGVTTYIDGPFYPDEELGAREQMKKLSSQVFEAMEKRARLSTYTPIEYVKDAPAVTRADADVRKDSASSDSIVNASNTAI